MEKAAVSEAQRRAKAKLSTKDGELQLHLEGFDQLMFGLPEIGIDADFRATDQITGFMNVAAVGYGVPMTRNSGNIFRLWFSISTTSVSRHTMPNHLPSSGSARVRMSTTLRSIMLVRALWLNQ